MGKLGEQRLMQLASKQCGIFTARDLQNTNLSRSWLHRRLETGEFSRVQFGTFKVGPDTSEPDECDMAALLGAGEGAVLSHLSAARRLSLDVPRNPMVHVTIRASREVRLLVGVRVWRSRDLLPNDVTQRGPFRVTNLARTMIDLAAVVDDAWLRAALDSALRQRRSYQDWLYRIIRERGAGHRGVARLRALLDEYQREDEVPDSALESFAMQLAVATGHRPRLHWNVVEDERRLAEVDLAWPEAKLGVEVDGWTHHRGREAFEEDRARDRSLFAHGWAVLRYTWRQVDADRDGIVAELAQAYDERLRQRALRAAS